VLVANRLPVELADVLRTSFPVIGPLRERSDVASCPETERQAVRVFVTMGGHRTDRALMDLLPNLGFICVYGTGYDGVDLDAARDRGIVVATGYGANERAVAEHAVALLLAVVRGVPAGDSLVRSGRWAESEKTSPPRPTATIVGRRLGIFGLGAIGSRVAAYVAGFGMEIGYHGRTRRDVPHRFFERLVDLAEWADVLLIATRPSAATHRAVGGAVLAALGRHGFLVNVARGSIVDEAALIAALEQGTIAGAALDVFDGEPHVSERLRALPNVVLSPHHAGLTVDSEQEMFRRVVGNVSAFFSGKPLVSQL
jgi:lactate dehydrogenase-like 2-hydroxyacid dehydrogenase